MLIRHPRAMAKLAAVLALILCLASGATAPAAAAANDGLIAIDILLLPDATMAAKARAVNAQLRQDYPAGYALDATHVPHMTLVQCYIRAADLPAVTAAVRAVFDRSPPAGMGLTATGYFKGPIAGVDVTGILVRTAPALARLQQEIATALAPLSRHGGGVAAFIDAPKSATIGWTAAYVDNFAAKSSGANYGPHVTTGIATPEFVARLAAAPFAPFAFTVRGAAIYQLGDIGTARKPLWTWRQ